MPLKNLFKYLEERQGFTIGAGIITALVYLDLVKALVDNLLMPFVGAFSDSGDFHQLTLNLGKIHLGIGNLIEAFLVLLLVVWGVGWLWLFTQKARDETAL